MSRFTIDFPLRRGPDGAEPDHSDIYEPGDLLVTARTVHRVVEVLPVDSTVWPNRWKVTTEKLADRSPDGSYPQRPDDGCRVRHTSAYRKGETAASYYGVSQAVVDEAFGR